MKTKISIDECSVTHSGVEFRFYIAQNTKEPTLVLQMLQRKKGIALSIGLDTLSVEVITRAFQKRLAEM